jgi:hypothetical protein
MVGVERPGTETGWIQGLCSRVERFNGGNCDVDLFGIGRLFS